MIKLSSINEQEFYLNPFIIESVEEDAHTVISLTNGKNYVVKNSTEDIIEQCKSFYKEINVFPFVNSNSK